MDIVFSYMAHDGRLQKEGKLEALQRDLCIFHQQTQRGTDKHYLQGVQITFPNHTEIRIQAKRSKLNQHEIEPPDDILIIFTQAYFEIGPPGIARRVSKKRYPLAAVADPQARFTHLQSQIREWSALPRPRPGLFDAQRRRHMFVPPS